MDKLKKIAYLFVCLLAATLMFSCNHTVNSDTSSGTNEFNFTDTFTTNTGVTEYTGNYSKVTASVASGYEGSGIAHSDNHPITIETLHGEIIDKVVLSGVTNGHNARIHLSSGNVTNTCINDCCKYNLNVDGAIEIVNVNATTLTISFHPGAIGTVFYANVAVYGHGMN